MKRVIVALIVCSWSLVNGLWSMAQIGTWRNYLAYHDVQQIQAAGDYLFVMASNGLYQYNKNDQSITTYDKVNALSDVTITNIRWCPQAKRLVIVYDNSNIDLIETNGNVTNISDIFSKAIIGGKNIHSIIVKDQYAYLGCDFGVVKLDVKKAEVSETYMLGLVANEITIDNRYLYIYNYETGAVWSALLTDNLIDKSNWARTENFPSFEQDNSDYTNNIDLVKTLQPGGPHHGYFGWMVFANNKLYTANGDYDHGKPIQILNSNNEWTIYEYEGISDATGVSFQGSYCFDIDPTNENHIFSGSRNGLYEYLNGKFVKYYDSSNSPFVPYDGKDKEYQLVTGTKYDSNGTLWLLNSSASNTSLVSYNGSTFTKHNHAELMKLNSNSSMPNRSNANLSQMMIDSRGLLWFMNCNWLLPAFYKYNMQTDEITAYERFVNQDGITINIIDQGVNCIKEDKEGNMWIGTTVGPVVLMKDDIGNDAGNVTLTQVKVPRNDGTDYADYLMSGVNINCMAIDGGNRKWFGTMGNGIYLVSADNMEQLQHFTTDNSPLLSNTIQSLAINPTTGEVFIGTDKGLCSYFSDATEPQSEMSKDNVWAYPNPVNPDYTGLITVTGLSYNADVKILSANGALVAEGRSNGGIFTWDGCNKKGERVASGIYMVVTATNDGQKGTVCKIAIVR